ncbi:hypothetical protein [Gloeobacter violaceus]|nr:hypothetical protein [Gloeobacter violaceus]
MPDIEVEQPLAYAQGRDGQKEKALEVLFDRLAAPPTGPPQYKVL